MLDHAEKFGCHRGHYYALGVVAPVHSSPVPYGSRSEVYTAILILKKSHFGFTDAVPGKLRTNDAQRSIDIPGGVRTFDVSQTCNVIVTGGLDKVIRVCWVN